MTPSLSIADNLVYVYTILGSFFAGTKIVPVRASVHTQEQWFPSRSEAASCRIGVHTIPDRFSCHHWRLSRKVWTKLYCSWFRFTDAFEVKILDFKKTSNWCVLYYWGGHILSSADTNGVVLERADSAAAWIYTFYKSTLPLSLLTSVFSFFLTAGWDRTVSFCGWISILGCLSHKHDGRWFMGWSRDSTRRCKLFSNVHPRDQQSSTSPWPNDLPRVWCYW